MGLSPVPSVPGPDVAGEFWSKDDPDTQLTPEQIDRAIGRRKTVRALGYATAAVGTGLTLIGLILFG